MHLHPRTLVVPLGIGLVLLLLVIHAPPAWAAHSVAIDPGAYTGRYSVPGASNLTGPQTVSLATGTHTLTIGPGAVFQFTVDAGGSVTSLNTAAATGLGGTLQFNTAVMHVDPQLYSGTYWIRGVDEAQLSGSRTVVVLPGISGYLLNITTANGFRFDVDAAGSVSSQTPSAATGAGNTLSLHTIAVHVDPASYTGTYWIRGVDHAEIAGARDFHVLPGLTGYLLNITTANGFRFDVDAAGNVSSQIPAAATGSLAALQFHTTVVHVDPASYTGTSWIRGVDHAEIAGARDYVVLPGLTGYLLNITTANGFRFNVDAAGDVTSQVAAAAQGIGSTLRFHTSTVLVEPVAYTGTYAIRGVDDLKLAGPRCFTLMPGLTGYFLRLASGAANRFDVDAAGTPSPATLLIVDGGETRSFELSADCGNEAPTADAGLDQAIHAGATVQLDGSASFDDQTASGDLAYAWSFVTVPVGSSAMLSGAGTSAPSFVVDVPGAFEVQLVVTDDEGLESAADIVDISSNNLAPTADAGTGLVVNVGEDAALDGLGSSDPDSDVLAYQWEIVSAPIGSMALLDDELSALPTLVPDLEGTYVIALVVSDFYADSAPAEVTVTVIGPLLAQQLLRDACEVIAALPDGSFDARGHRKSLCNEVSRILRFIERDELDKAADHLAGLIERVDGCALRGSPDPKGGGQPNAADHITDCADQLAVYDELVAAEDALTGS